MDEIDEPVSRFPRRDRPSSVSTAFLSPRCSDRRIVVIRQQLFTYSFVYLRAIQHGNFAGILASFNLNLAERLISVVTRNGGI